MSRPSRQRMHLNKIRHCKSKDILAVNDANEIPQVENIQFLDDQIQCEMNDPKPSPTECVFATLVSGQTFTSASKFNSHMNRPFTSKASFYRAQNKIHQVIEECAQESMKNAREQMGDNTIVSGDGRYPIRRNASHCTFDVIDTKSNKILALGVVDKKSFFHPNESFDKTSNLMESEAMRRSLNQLDDCKNKICGFALDGDNKNPKILNQDDFNPIVYKDPNHLSLSFNKYLDSQLSEFKRMIPGISDCFRYTRDKIKDWYSFLVHSPLDAESKKEAWLNTVPHLLGDHDKCFYHKETSYVWETGLNHPEAAEQLYFILLQKIGDFDEVFYDVNTQKNESFHEEQLCYGNKNVFFPRSQIIRDYMAVLRHNEGFQFEFDLRKRLQLPEISFQNQEKIYKNQSNREVKSGLRKTITYRQNVNSYRKKRSALNKKNPIGDYKPPEKDFE